MINVRMQEKEVHALSPKITVIGVGGAGGNAVNNMITSNLDGVEFLVCNTDSQAINGSLCENKIQLGTGVTRGLGAGAKPEVGRAAAEESLDEIMSYLEGSNMVFITAGMGGGTGTGAAPEIARAARESGILTIGVVTKPFHFEGSHRMKMAEEGIHEMQQYVDTLIVIPNQNLFRVANEKTTFAEAFKMADSVLLSGVKGVTDLMVMPGLINLDFADIRSAMLDQGKAMLGTGEASGDRRAVEAAEAAINNPLLDDVSMKGARGVIINITGGYDMTLFEADEACNRIREEVDSNANIIFGSTFDESLDGVMRISVVATGIDGVESQKANNGGQGNAYRAGPRTQTVNTPPEDASKKVFSNPVASTPVSSAAASIQNLRAPARTDEPTQEVISDEPEDEMFEQNAYSVSGASRGPQTPPALRGARHQNAFIPPKPMEVERPAVVNYAAGLSAPVRSMQSAMAENVSAAKKSSHSLFERLTGMNGGTREDDGQEDIAPVEEQSAQMSPSEAPTQGQLNIDAPSKKPASEYDDELDIPAFLRRQAN